MLAKATFSRPPIKGGTKTWFLTPPLIGGRSFERSEKERGDIVMINYNIIF